MSQPSPYIHLHLHSTYSFLDGFCDPVKLAVAAAARGTKALALTDHGNLHGAFAFSKAMKDHGIKPILGCEVYRSKCQVGEKPEKGTREKLNHLTLLASNDEGWRNLCQLTSQANLENFYGKPRITDDMIRAHGAGLICLSGCMQGKLARAIIEGRRDDVFAEMDFLMEVFGRERLFLEVHNHQLPDQDRLNAGLVWLHKKYNVQLCGANDVHYINKEDAQTHDFLLAVSTNSDINDPNRLRYLPCDQFYLKSREEMAESLSGLEGALEGPDIVAERCNFDLQTTGTRYPTLPGMIPGQSVAMLQAKCERGILEGRIADSPQVRERMQYELGVIAKSGFADYFHIVSDIREHARNKDIPQGPGRGSAAGSLVAYLMGITDIDPMPNGLYFERFLNPDRISPPDIDLDFCHLGRAEMLSYIRERYGVDKVCQIATYQKYGPRLAVRDALRVHGVPMKDVDRISVIAPKTLDQYEENFFDTDPSIQKEKEKDPRVKSAIELAKQVVGIPRNMGVHASAVVASPVTLAELAPLARSNDGEAVIQADMSTVEALGFLKLDILGLKTVTVINEATKMIREHSGNFDPNQIPNEDAKTAELWKNGGSFGVFQVEQEEVRRFSQELPVKNRDDFALVTAVFRPGAMDQADALMRRRRGEEEATPLHPAIEEVTKSTEGILVYQEQVMEAARKFAGYSLGEADILRRAMGKKKPEEMEKMKKGFVEGAKKLGRTEEEAVGLFDEIAKFAGYGFNKSHAVAYATMSWRTAYIKAHHPLEFYSAVMRFEANDSAKLAEVIADAGTQGFQVKGPDINKSEVHFAPRDGQVLFGLGDIKGIGEAAAEQIVKLRPFSGFYDACGRILTDSGGKANIKTLRALADAGAFDCYGERGDIIALLADPKARKNLTGSLFNEIPKAAERPSREGLFAKEVAVCGWCFSDNPYDEYLGLRPTLDAVPIKNAPRGQDVSVLAMVLSKKAERSKKSGRPYGTITLSDETGVLRTICFPARKGGKATTDISPEFKRMEPGKVFLVRGKVDDGGQMIIRAVDEVKSDKPQSLIVMAKAATFQPASLKAICQSMGGGGVTYPCRVAYSTREMREGASNDEGLSLPLQSYEFRKILQLPGVKDIAAVYPSI